MQQTRAGIDSNMVSLVYGLIFGLITGTIDSIYFACMGAPQPFFMQVFLQPIYSLNNTLAALILTIPIYLLLLVAFVLVGLLASRETQKMSTGLLAGLWTGIVFVIIDLVVATIVVLYLIVFPQMTTASTVDKNSLLSFDVGYSSVAGLILIGIGAGLGALGGLWGKHVGALVQPVQSVEPIQSEATRHLCTAAYLDEKVRDYIMTHIVEEEHKAVGELYKEDMVAIVKWCFIARERTLIRDIALFVWLLITVIVSIEKFGAQTSGSGNIVSISPPLWFFLVFIPVILILISLLGSIPSLSLLIAVIVGIFVFPSFPQILLFLLGAWVIVMIEAGISYYGNRAMQLTRNRFGSNNLKKELNNSKLEKRLKTITDKVNVVVYSGYSPFVGAGSDLDGWSFSVDTSKGKQKWSLSVDTSKGKQNQELEPLDIEGLLSLYDRVEQGINSLDLDKNDLLIEDKLYVNGQVIRGNDHFFDENLMRARTRVPSHVIEQFKAKPEQDIRYYKRIRVTSWKEELVLSVFIRFVKAGKSLFAETNYLLLLPPKKEYRDAIEPVLTIGKVSRLAGTSLLSGFSLWFRSPVKIFFAIFHRWFLTWKRKNAMHLMQEDPAFNYGASSSLREFVASKDYRQHFQRLDKEMYVKMIQKKLLETIINFLDERNIDTSDLKERGETILNNGVIVQGGTIHAENVAVGDHAKAIFSGVVDAVTGSTK